MTKPTKWLCAQQNRRSAWASAQSDQSLRCPHEESLGPYLPTERTVKTLIGLGCSASSLGAQSFCWFCHGAPQVSKLLEFEKLFKKSITKYSMTAYSKILGEQFQMFKMN